ncbi:MAG TPA: formate dehydrogenase, partial [Methylomirabilota bacterium]
MTTNLIDIQHSDVIMATSNFAENHPVGFQWVMKAKERGAKFIHVDPRFTRTSSVADIHVPLRSGTNIAFFGGLISYAIQNNLYFKDYVTYYTNASFLIDPAFKTATDGGGLFTGLEQTGKGGADPHVAETYKRDSWKYQLDGEGNPKRDLTLRDPHSVFQLMRRHYSRYTPEMVERVCGIPKEKFVQV